MTRGFELPSIPGQPDPDMAVTLCLEVGACLMPSVLDAKKLLERVRIYSPNLTFDDNRELTAQLKTDKAAPDILRGLSAAFKRENLQDFNRAKMSIFENGHVSPPHIDDLMPIDGVTALIPLEHGARLRLHSGNWLDEPDTANTHVSEYESLYVPGDVVLLRQEIPERDLAPKVHSAETVFMAGAKSPLRYLLSLDHALI